MVGLVVSAVVLALCVMVIVSQRQSVKRMKDALRQAQNKTIDLETKIELSRDELKKSKSELEREKGALRDARELTKKKFKRQALASNQEGSAKDTDAMTNNVDLESEKAIKALEAQIEQMKVTQAENEESIRARLAEEMTKDDSEKAKVIDDLKKKIGKLEEDLKKQRRLMRPEGTKVDLKTLPDEAAGEFARIYRKADHHEKLHGIARAKLHLAQEKFAELQKRYFSVCRELAVAVGKNDDINESEARDEAEKLVAKGSSEEEFHSAPNGDSTKNSSEKTDASS